MTGERPPWRGVHDVGGSTRWCGPVDRTEHEHAMWEHRIDALMVLLSGPGRQLLTVDELRRNIESLGAEAYTGYGYYERWMHAIAETLLARGVITLEELKGMMETPEGG